MTDNEELICRSWNRDLFEAWRGGEITFPEAVFLARRVEIHACMAGFLPDLIVRVALALFDVVYERRLFTDDAAHVSEEPHGM